MNRQSSFARFLATTENRAALQAVEDIADALASSKTSFPNPLLLHGPPGCGKSHLVTALVREVSRAKTGLVVKHLSARDFKETAAPLTRRNLASDEATPAVEGLDEEARHCGLLIIEDLQHLPAHAIETVVQLIDYRLANNGASVFTALQGPRHLERRGNAFPARLTSRLAGGLVVGIEALQAPDRLVFLDREAQRLQLAVPREILEWLAQHLTGGGRQLERAIKQLEEISKLRRGTLTLETVAQHFGLQADALKTTVDRIAKQVGGYFQLEPRQLQSRRRYRNILVPRQIGMYLARKLTPLSLNQIGEYFGGRDHSTVLHACRKVEESMKEDVVLLGAVRQIHSELA